MNKNIVEGKYSSKTNKSKRWFLKWIVAGSLICVLAVGVGFFSATGLWGDKEKKPSDYSWEEFEALTDEEKLAFSQSFEGDSFAAWVNSVTENTEPIQAENPWDNGGKQPGEYTWEEFEMLSDEQKLAFSGAFAAGEFEKWLKSVERQELNSTQPQYPWDNGGKRSEEYTWEEFDKLTDEQKLAFSQEVGADMLEKQMADATEPEASDPDKHYSWEHSWKEPADYTWLEFEALTDEEKIAFSQTFSEDGFADWMNNAKKEETPKVYWSIASKRPDRYTWEEFEALTPNQQTEFYNWFSTKESFEAWMNGAKSK